MCIRDREWVKNYSVFRAFKKANEGRCWLEWPQWQRDWPKTRQGDLGKFAEEIAYHSFLQYQFLNQWKSVREYAHQKGVRIMGDVPFYVGVDSVDVWAGRENFLLDEDGRPTFIAGVPPDYFSATGQRWGNPCLLYTSALKGENGQKSWLEWPDEVRLREPQALRRAAERLAGPVRYWKGVQYLFHRQWTALKAYAKEKGVAIIGDIPIYVSPDSSDIWAGPELFQLTADRRMAAVAGCPPDAFAADEMCIRDRF